MNTVTMVVEVGGARVQVHRSECPTGGRSPQRGVLPRVQERAV